MSAALAPRLFLGALLVSVVALLWWILGDKTWDEPVPVKVDRSLFEVPKQIALTTSEPDQEVVERPLFERSRRPPAVAKAAEQEPDPIDKLTIHGIFGSTNNGGVIVTIDGAVRRVRIGGKLGPWTLRSIEGLHLNLVDDAGTQRKLRMRHLPQVESAPPAAATTKPSAAADAPPTAPATLWSESKGESEPPAQPSTASPPNPKAETNPIAENNVRPATTDQSGQLVTADESGKKRTRFRY